jgi:hypothetical protein
LTITEPLPAGGYGKANWTDYSNYWREGDAEWLMERTVLRYGTTAARNADWPTPKFGQITYNEQAINLGSGLFADRPEMWSKQHNAWVPLLMLANIMGTKDDATGVGLAHKSAGGKGVVFEPTRTVLDNPIYVMGGVLTVDATGLTVKTGAKTVKLTTDAVGLVSDSPISATALSTAGTLTAVSATLSGSLTVPNITASGTIQGGTFRGAVDGTTVNASTSGTIGGVSHSGSIVTANSGVISQGAYISGNASMGYFQYRNPSGGAVSSQVMTVDNTYIRFRASNGMPWDRADGQHTGGWVACVFTSDPGAANAPTGSILLT